MRVVVVFDPDYGARDKPDLGDALWLVESPQNRALAQRAWAEADTGADSTVFQPRLALSPDDEAMSLFDDTDLHHPTWSEMTFIGARLTQALERRFADLGLDVGPTQAGFFVRR